MQPSTENIQISQHQLYEERNQWVQIIEMGAVVEWTR